MSPGAGRGRASPLRAMAELRMLLTLRRVLGRGGVPELVARTVMLALAGLTGLGFGVGTGIQAYLAVRSRAPLAVGAGTAGLFFGILLSWVALSLTLSDRESFDLRRLLVYPVPPAQSYAYELAAGLVGDPFAIVWLLMLAGAFAGAALARPGAWVLWLALVHLLFAVGVVCLVSLAQEVLARALRRRRVRELGVAAIYIGLILVVVQGAGGALRALKAAVALRWLAYPGALAVEAATRLYQGRASEALPWIAAMGLAAAATAWAAYRLALGDALAGVEGGQARGAAAGGGWRIPGRVGPILEKELKYLLRHPLMAVLLLVIPAIAGVVGWRAMPLYELAGADEVKRAFPLFGFALYALLVTQALWLNTFGWDRGGVRVWFLAPVPLADVLRAKNAAVRVVAFAIFAASAGVLFATSGLPPSWAILAALALHLGLGPWFVTAGNVVSILNARPGSHALQRGGNLAPMSALVGMAIVSGGAALFLPPVFLVGWFGNPWLLVGAWAALGLAGAAVRRAALPATVRLLERRREALLAAVAGDDA